MLRPILPLLPLLGLLLFACASAPPEPAPRPDLAPATDPDRLMEQAIRAFASGEPGSVALLAAAGELAAPFIEPLTWSPDEDTRRRALLLLHETGEIPPITPEERVGLLVFAIEQPEPWPCSSLRALAELRSMGEDGRVAVERIAAGTGSGAETARRLLSRLSMEATREMPTPDRDHADGSASPTGENPR